MNYTVGITNCIIQIGLFQACEYIYVTQNRWGSVKNRVNDFGDSADLPIEILDNSVWYYYGIDMSEYSIDFVKNRYKEYANCEFINSLVYGKDNEMIRYENIISGRNKVSLEGKLISKSVSLKTLLSNIPYTIKSVVIDVECSELDILSNYDFSIRPDSFVIESHNMYISNKLINLFNLNGYSLVNRDITNNFLINYFDDLPTDSLTFISNVLLSKGRNVITKLDYVANYINEQ